MTVLFRLGSIPACAGEPVTDPSEPYTLKVYPRVCGGTSIQKAAGCWRAGLSPRVRGNLQQCRFKSPSMRSIPACAGEPSSAEAKHQLQPVYPRVCGGTIASRRPYPVLRGLSPRVRGNRLHWVPSRYRKGSIPACAGEPSSSSCGPLQCPVYPRVCGGTEPSRSLNMNVRGLSPRVRGNRPAEVESGYWQGSIPACAGEPE